MKASDITKTKRQLTYLISLKSALINNSVFTEKEKQYLTDIYNQLITKYNIAIQNKVTDVDTTLNIYNV